MPSMNVVFTQILVILLYILIGYAAGKLRLRHSYFAEFFR